MRRMFRRNIRKTLSQNVPPLLQEANFVFDKGEYGRAGELFDWMKSNGSMRSQLNAPIAEAQYGNPIKHKGHKGLQDLIRGTTRRFPWLFLCDHGASCPEHSGLCLKNESH
jgi:hypothetical protein